MNSCSTGDGRKGSVTWPLAGNVTLCHNCYENPPAAYASLVAASREPPDDFDIPIDTWDTISLPAWMRADTGYWVTKKGAELRFVDIDNDHLENIVRMILRIKQRMDRSNFQGPERRRLEQKLLQARKEQKRRLHADH